ncbi:MAG: hypothetical protein R2836_06215 [Chitinophagales bacterium]
MIATLNGSGSYTHTGNVGESITVRFDSDGSVTYSGFEFTVRYDGYDIGEETGNETTADCVTRTFGFGSGAAETFALQTNTNYYFSWSSGTGASGFRGVPNSGSTITTDQSAWNSGSATSIRFSSNRLNNCSWTNSSSTLTYRVVTPGSVSVSGGGTQCGGSRTITASGGANGTIYFQGTTSNGTSTATPSTSESITSSGTYYFRAMNGGCWGTQGSVNVTINSVPSATTVSGGGTFCGNTTITASGGSGGTIYFQGTTSNGTSTATASTSENITSSGTYYFRSRRARGCWGTEGSVNVNYKFCTICYNKKVRWHVLW